MAARVPISMSTMRSVAPGGTQAATTAPSPARLGLVEHPELGEPAARTAGSSRARRCSTRRAAAATARSGRRRTTLANTSARASTRSGPAGMIWIVTTRRVSGSPGRNGSAAGRRRLAAVVPGDLGRQAMEYRTLGSTGVSVSTHCLGAMMFGAWGNTDVEDCVRIIHAALDAGINFVDTADVYSSGESEEIVGRALKGRATTSCSRPRCTATWGRRQPAGQLARCDHARGRGQPAPARHRPHRPVSDPPTRAADRHRGDAGRAHRSPASGKIRYFGSSTFPGWQMVEAQWTAERRGLARFRSEQPAVLDLRPSDRAGTSCRWRSATAWACWCGARSAVGG
jgi:hypothetical protein